MTWSRELGDFGSFLEMAFAINVLFFTWAKPGEALTEWLIRRARGENENSRVELEETDVRERIVKFQEKCAKSIPKWRLVAGLIALGILAAQFLLADNTPIPMWGWRMWVVATAVSPLVGIAIFLGVPALICARRNSRDLKPPLRTLGQMNVMEIGDRIRRGKPSEDERSRP